jgi:dTDP-4-amino-4,6-dideoxygalactose transaminase
MADFLPYGRQSISDADIEAVVSVLRGDWLTTGPAVQQFETDLAAHTGGTPAVAVTSGTAA